MRDYEMEINVPASLIIAGLPCACGWECCPAGTTCEECREEYEGREDKREYPRDVRIADIVIGEDESVSYYGGRDWYHTYPVVEDFRVIDCISRKDITSLLDQDVIDQIVDHILKYLPEE